jgi:hypothetical protein
MSDTVGVVYRAGTGNVDPWTKQQIIDDAAASNIAAGADPATAQRQAEADVTATLKTFSLGGDDPTGADPSQTTGLRLPSDQAQKTAWKSLTNDDGSGCGLTNLGGCMPEIPAWVKWTAGGLAVLAALWLIRPYVGLAAAVRS